MILNIQPKPFCDWANLNIPVYHTNMSIPFFPVTSYIHKVHATFQSTVKIARYDMLVFKLGIIKFWLYSYGTSFLPDLGELY